MSNVSQPRGFRYYPSDWRGSRWVVIDPSLAFRVPAKPACYVVYLDGALAYIGQSSDVRKRFQNYNIRPSYTTGYITPWGRYETVQVKFRFPTRYGDWAMRELRLIRRLRPPMNCVGGQRPRAIRTAS